MHNDDSKRQLFVDRMTAGLTQILVEEGEDMANQLDILQERVEGVIEQMGDQIDALIEQVMTEEDDDERRRDRLICGLAEILVDLCGDLAGQLDVLIEKVQRVVARVHREIEELMEWAAKDAAGPADATSGPKQIVREPEPGERE